MSNYWNVCACGKQTRYRTGKTCHTCQKRKQVSGESARDPSKPWNQCQTCPKLAMYRSGIQCHSCAQKKYCRKNTERNKEKCSLYYWLNRDKERARRKAYYQAHREEEILNATLRRYNKQKKKKATNVQETNQCSATSRGEEGTQSTGQDGGSN